MPEEQNPLDFFSGGVPAFWILIMHLESIAELLSVPIAVDDATVQELAYIGVVSYTEAFFKDHFASVINIFPDRVILLRKCGRDTSVDVADLLDLDDPLHNKFGFLISERLNFGSPKAVNSLYKDLLLLSPFSKDKMISFESILSTRNLLVHHGGIVTTQFGRNVTAALQERRYYDSLRITKKQVAEAALLALEIAKGTVKGTVLKLVDELEKIPAADLRRRAFEYLDLDLDNEDELSSKLMSLIAGDLLPVNAIAAPDEEISF